MNSQDSEKTKQFAEGTIGQMLGTQSIGYVFLALLGQVATSDVD